MTAVGFTCSLPFWAEREGLGGLKGDGFGNPPRRWLLPGLQGRAYSRCRGRVVAGNKSGDNPRPRLRWGAAVVYNEAEVLCQVIESGPAVQLLPLVCTHEPVEFILRG